MKVFLNGSLPEHTKNQIVYDFQNTPIWFSPDLNLIWESSSVEQILYNENLHSTLNLKAHISAHINTVPVISMLMNKVMNLQLVHGDKIQLFHLVQVSGNFFEYLQQTSSFPQELSWVVKNSQSDQEAFF